MGRLVSAAMAVDNGGMHAVQKVSRSVRLGRGHHSLRAEFFKNAGGAMVVVQWKGPDKSRPGRESSQKLRMCVCVCVFVCVPVQAGCECLLSDCDSPACVHWIQENILLAHSASTALQI